MVLIIFIMGTKFSKSINFVFLSFPNFAQFFQFLSLSVFWVFVKEKAWTCMLKSFEIFVTNARNWSKPLTFDSVLGFW